MQSHPSVEVRVRSVPSAAALICMGHEPLRVAQQAGNVFVVFASEARAALDKYNHAKQRVDDLIERAL